MDNGRRRTWGGAMAIGALGAALIAAWGCAIRSDNPPRERNSRLYGVVEGPFLHRFWFYYDRGRSFLEGDFYPEAEADFRRALDLWGRDGRRTRVEGRHLMDYFPNRELGVALHGQGRHAAAIRALDASLRAVKSARAEYYLDMARRALLKETGADRGPPTLRVDAPAPDGVENGLSVVVAGVAWDDAYVKGVEIDGRPIRVDLAAPEVPFRAEVPLRMGENRIEITAWDLMGNRTRTTRHVRCDRIGPTIGARLIRGAVANGEGAARGTELPEGFHLSGYAHDPAGIRRLTIDGRDIPKAGQEPAREIRIEQPMEIPPAMAAASEFRPFITLTATDMAGNRTVARIPWQAEPPGASSADTAPPRASVSPAPAFFQGRTLLAANVAGAATMRGIATTSRRIAAYSASGTDHALLIGINAYHHWKPLETAVNDVTAMRRLLTERYGYARDNARTLTDGEATWAATLHRIRSAAAGLRPGDNLLLYYAGHGRLDDLTGDGYWIPADGAPADASTWITHSAVRRLLGGGQIPARSILIIADSCYSGALLKEEGPGPMPAALGSSPANPTQIQAPPGFMPDIALRGRALNPADARPDLEKRVLDLAARRSRQVVCSGGLEPVSDLGREGHSLFAFHLLDGLGKNRRRIIDIEYLYTAHVWKPVTDRGGQRPAMGRLGTTMDEGGQFVFVQREEDGAEPGPGGLAPTLSAYPLDSSPPVIAIHGDPDGRTVYLDRTLLEISAHDPDGIQCLYVDDRKVIDRPGRNLHVNHIVSLNEGENHLMIRFMDQLGNQGERRLVVRRKTPAVYGPAFRMAVAPFVYMDGPPDAPAAGMGRMARGGLMDRLIRSGRFRILWAGEGPPAVNGDMGEMESAAMAAAAAAGADYALICRVSPAGAEGLQMSAQMTEIQSRRILTFQDVYAERQTLPELRILGEALALKLIEALPMTEGRVVGGVKGDRLMIGVGGEDGVREGMRVVFFRNMTPEGPVGGGGAGVGRVGRVDGVDGVDKADEVDEADEVDKADEMDEAGAGARFGWDAERLGFGRVVAIRAGSAFVERIDGGAASALPPGARVVMQ